MDEAHGYDNSTISWLSESLGISGFDKEYSLFIVTECSVEYIEPDRFFIDGLAFLLLDYSHIMSRKSLKNVEV